MTRRPRLPARQGLMLAGLLSVAVLSAGCEPKDRRPGMWLSGTEATTPIDDWSFVNDAPEVQIETHPWYGIPFSVTTVIAAAGNRVFVPSIYDEPVEFPGTKYWNRVIAADPAVRLRVDGKLYHMIAYPAADDAEFAEGLAALAAKYDFWRDVSEGGKDIHFAVIRLEPVE